MSLTNSNAVAMERRMDLASLFCMIGRHGPAVAVAVIAMVSVLAGFIIYRTVRGKRRKATAADSDDETPGAERDASVIQQSPEENHSSVKATELREESSSELIEDLIQSDHKIRHRSAAAAAAAAPAEKKPSLYFSPKDDIQVPEDKNTTSDDITVQGDSFKVHTHVKEASQSPRDDSYTKAKMVVKDVMSDSHSATNTVTEDGVEEVHDINSCLRDPEKIIDENNKEDQVCKSAYRDDKHVVTDEDVSDKKTRQEEETSCTRENEYVDELQEDVTTVETNGVGSILMESVMEDAPVSIICNVKEEEFESPDPESVTFSYPDDNLGSAEEQNKIESEEAEVECEDSQIIPQQLSKSDQETNQPSLNQDQGDHVMDEWTPPVERSDGVEYSGPTEEMSEEVTDEYNTAVDTHCQQFEEEEAEIEQNEENIITSSQQDGDKKEKVEKTSENIIAFVEESGGQTVETSPSPSCLSASKKAETKDDNLSDVTTDENDQISGNADHPDISSGFQQPLREYESLTSPDEDANSTTLESQKLSHDIDREPTNTGNDQTVASAGPSVATSDGENVTEVFPPHDVSSCHREQQSLPISVVEKAENKPPSPLMEEEISLLDVSPPSQDRATDPTEPFDETEVSSASNDHMKNTIEEINITSATDIPSFDKASLASPTTCEDQPSNGVANIGDISEVTASSAPVMTVDLSPSTCHMYRTSFEQSDLGDPDPSSPSFGKESGISSMAVSPDLQDVYNGFEVIDKNIVECILPSTSQEEPKNSLFGDYVAAPYSCNENTAGMVFGPYKSHQPQSPRERQTGRTEYESYAANEDMFGHQIEDSYHRDMEKFMEQIVNNITSLAGELKEEPDKKVTVEVVEKTDKKAKVGVDKKAETDAEEEEAVESEKTEISIMEATMDNNEWITESNYPVLPWMNISAPSIIQELSQNNQLPTEKCVTATVDVSCVDPTEDPPVTEVKHGVELSLPSSLSLVDENSENNKKVLAVQPMPQNVNVTFRVHYFAQSPYQTVAITGDQQELGNWKEFIPLERAKNGHWATVVSLPAESHVEWKFVLLDKGEVCRWEECGNRLLETGSGDDLLVHKWWGFL
ncbi:enolase-phosphatase E1 [Xyrichtys novacula]|uniref:Starch-binding domain-containing protein 1 n=1 Tax=Xyrichtys novacula TaxID=13765 RepID=A0AAV1GB00_XYRNO|nr:enolase-phosphatase E1 [Xyrichtys novacula]